MCICNQFCNIKFQHIKLVNFNTKSHVNNIFILQYHKINEHGNMYINIYIHLSKNTKHSCLSALRVMNN